MEITENISTEESVVKNKLNNEVTAHYENKNNTVKKPCYNN